MDTLSTDTISAATLSAATGTGYDTPSPLAEVLAAAAIEYGDRPALSTDDGDLTYDELAAAVTTIAARLRESGVETGSAVAVHLPRSRRAILAIHAIIATGAVVAPLDVTDPPGRTAALLAGASITHVVVAAGIETPVFAADSESVEIGDGLRLLTLSTAGDGASHSAFTEPGYLLFTSGSTGTPKGVLLSCPAVLHFAVWAARSLELSPGDRVAAQAALTFDLSIFDLFSTVLAGATTVLLPDWMKAFPADALEWMAQQEISVIYAVPTLLRGLVTAAARQPDAVPPLRAVAFAGEPYPVAALGELLEVFGETEVRNWYGPTETNVCTAADMRQWQPGAPIPIGTALPGVQAWTVDENLRPADEGELVIAGASLLTGYLLDGELVDPTVELVHPDGTTRRAYRTGDRARTDSDGQLFLAGRIDAQVKRRGYRIDLAGIEAIAGQHAAAAAAVVSGPDNRITLFIDPAAPADSVSEEATVELVTNALREVLHVTSHPDAVIALSPLPTNARGKIDKIELGKLASEQTQKEN